MKESSMARGDAVVAVDWLNRKASKRRERQGLPPAQSASAIEQLLWEQRQTNKMLWALLSPEQQELFRAQP
jgi:hypothetical protein